MPYLNIPENTLGPSISKLIGSLRGTFESDVSSNVNTLGNSFRQGCPNNQQKALLNTKLNNIKETSVNVSDRLNRFRKIPPPLKSTSRAILALVGAIKFIPFPPFFPGGKIADVLNLVKELGIQLRSTATSIEIGLTQAGNLETLLKRAANISEKIDTALELCELAEQSGIGLPPNLINNLVNGTDSESAYALQELNKIVGRDKKSGQPDTRLKIPADSAEQYFGPDGETYAIEIVQVQSDFTRAPRRQAIAKNKEGVIKFESSKSFSSSIDVLKREVKFRIDNSQV